MAKQDTKLSFSDISFDDFIGDGLETANPKEGAAENIENEDELTDDELEDDSDVENEIEEDEDDDTPPAKTPKKKLESNDDDNDDDLEDEQEGEDSEASIAETIAKQLGYELENEYADTEEGLIEFTKDIAKEIAEDQLQSLFDQFPTVQKHLDFVLAGGDPDKFFEAYNPSLDYGNIEIDKSDSRTQKGFVVEYLRTKGHDDEFIKDMVEDYEDSGKLYDRAINAQKQLANIQAKEREQIVERQRREQLEAKQKQDEFWEGVANTIQEGREFAGIRIPEKEKAKFFDYISEPVDKSGKTRRDMDYANSELDVKLAIDYLMYKKMNLQDIITTKVRTESAKSLRDKIQSNQEKLKNYGKSDKRIRKFDPEQLDMKKLFE